MTNLLEKMTNLLEKTEQILADLIAFATVTFSDNRAFIHYVRDILEPLGARIITVPSPDGLQQNLIGCFGPEITGGVVLSGHSDVVPCEGQIWQTDPYIAHKENDRIYGRGSCDMKGFLACMLAMAPTFAQANLSEPIYLAFSYDEEVGCIGVQVMLDELDNTDIQPRLAIIGEPTNMQLALGHKSCCEYSTEFIGLDGHGSRPDIAVNAVDYASRYIAKMQELYQHFAAKPDLEAGFSPPHGTISIGQISGGVSRNTVAGQCTLEWEMRHTNQADHDFSLKTLDDFAENVLLPEMRMIHPDANITRTTIGEVIGLTPIEDSSFMQKLLNCNETILVPYGTEAGLFQQHGIDAVICGPGSINQAHRPNEYIAVSELTKCLNMMDKLCTTLTVKTP